MFSTEMFRLIADEREREVRHLLKVRALLSSRRERAVIVTPRKETRARGR